MKIPTTPAHEVAFDELALFANNATISYGRAALEPGMDKDEALTALQGAGFDEYYAEAFLKRAVDGFNAWWTEGRLVLHDSGR